MNLWRRSLADRDSLLLSLRGLCGERSSGQQAPGRYAWPPPFLLLLFSFFLLVLWAGASSLLTQDSGRAEYKAGKVYRIGILSPEILPPGLLETVRDELRQLGHIEGKTLTIEARNAEGRNERLPALADELLALKVDVILAVNTSAARAAKRATTTAPIVIARVADPVKSGLVASLSRPNGNVTGVSFMPDVVAVKGLELLKEALPRLSRVAALWYADNPGASIVVDEMQPAATQLALTLQRLPIWRSSDLLGAFETAVRHRAEAIVVVDDALVTKHRVEIVSLATKHSLPVLSEYKPFVEVGGLIAYGPSTAAMYRRAAHYVDKILRARNPVIFRSSSLRSLIFL